MLKKIFKGILITVGSLVIIALIFYTVVYFKTQSRINKEYAVNLQKLVIPSDSASYIAGQHIAENRGCMGCHGMDLAGGRAFADEHSPIGILYSANITSGKGGVNYTDEDYIRLLRHGLKKDNKSVWFMPSNDICHISNQEMRELISFVKQHPPVDKTVPAPSLKPLGRILTFLDKFPLLPAEVIDHNAVYKDEIAPAVTAEYGAYLATTCKGCHGNDMKGGPSHEPNGVPIADISSTGHVGKWQATDFITALRTGKTPEGKMLDDQMPYKFFTFTDDELKAIHLYLVSVK